MSIVIDRVTVAYKKKKVLDNFSTKFDTSGLYLITGASGSGKTTLMRLILGLVSQNSGSVQTNDHIISAVFQEDRLIPSLTALENVALVSDTERAKERLSQVGLADSQNLLPSELSGGMRRRVAIARALAFGGDVLLLDEAFNGIDEPLAKKIIADIVAEYNDRLIIAVTHQPELFEGFDYKEIKIE